MAHLEETVAGQVQRVPLDAKAITYLVGDGLTLKTTSAPEPGAVAAVYHSKRFFVLLSQGDSAVFVNQCKVSLIKIIREGDQVTVGTHGLTFRELTTEILPDGAPLIASRARCLVDGLPFKAGDHVVYCPECQTAHHERCWLYVKGRCANGRVCLYQAPLDEPGTKSI